MCTSVFSFNYYLFYLKYPNNDVSVNLTCRIQISNYTVRKSIPDILAWFAFVCIILLCWEDILLSSQLQSKYFLRDFIVLRHISAKSQAPKGPNLPNVAVIAHCCITYWSELYKAIDLVGKIHKFVQPKRSAMYSKHLTSCYKFNK